MTMENNEVWGPERLDQLQTCYVRKENKPGAAIITWNAVATFWRRTSNYCGILKN